MSNGIDSLANGNNRDLSNMLSSTPESSYVGTDFTGTVHPNQNVYDVGATGLVSMPVMFGTDSMNTLGSETEEGPMHEANEPKGPMGEDID